MDYLVVGTIQNTHGLKGELKVKSNSDFNRFIPGTKLYIKYKNDFVEVVVAAAKETPTTILVRFENLNDINLVEKYKGSDIVINKDDLDELEDNEYYYYELIGLDVYNQNGILRGKVVGIMELPQGESLEIDVNGKKRTVPLRDEFVSEITDDKIIIKEIEGLLWK